ncbi:hypothetical protein [Coralloluteibacterium thermophilus]|uniref:Thioredoxin domain-containing protein n=1 Tax=Coralloluteibacterium thermophilum TaxID=2707049 RepID=A0ABV9NMP1_9GAMM
MNRTPPVAPAPPDGRNVRAARRVMLILFALFFGGALVAGLLRFSGWQPGGSKAHGTLLQPAVDLRDAPAQGADGEPHPWAPAERVWRVAVLLPPGPCDGECETLAAGVGKVWELMGHRADKVEVLWAGALPAAGAPARAFVQVEAPDAWRERLPPAAADDPMPTYVIDPSGFVVLHYPTGFDIAGLRADLATLLKLK